MPREGEQHPQFSGCRWSTAHGTYLCDDGYTVDGEVIDFTWLRGQPAGAGIGPADRGGAGLGPIGSPTSAVVGIPGQVAGSGLGPGQPGDSRNRDADNWLFRGPYNATNIFSDAADSAQNIVPSSGTLATIALATGLSAGTVTLLMAVGGTLLLMAFLKSK